MHSANFGTLDGRILGVGHLTEQPILVVFPFPVGVVHALEPDQSLGDDEEVVVLVLALFHQHLPRREPYFFEHLEQLHLLPYSIRLEKRYVLTQKLLISRVVHPERFFHLEVVFVRNFNHKAVSEATLNKGSIVLHFILEYLLVEIVGEILDQWLRHLI